MYYDTLDPPQARSIEIMRFWGTTASCENNGGKKYRQRETFLAREGLDTVAIGFRVSDFGFRVVATSSHQEAS